MVERKIIFLDIDGTLCLEDGSILESSVYACTKARARGHRIFLCTGRSKPEIFDNILEIGFDGIIGTGGAYIEVDEEVLFQKMLTFEQSKHAVDYFGKKGIPFFLECDSGLYASKDFLPTLEKIIYLNTSKEELDQIKQRGEYHPFLQLMKSGENLYRDDVNKISFFDNNNVDFEEIKKEFEKDFQVIHGSVELFGPNSGEVGVLGINKASAIVYLLKHIGEDAKDCYAIGDGRNDIEMFEHCARSIAMGNAHPDLKMRAEHIVSSNNENGVYEAFDYLGLLD